jgi:hypothetical protein
MPSSIYVVYFNDSTYTKWFNNTDHSNFFPRTNWKKVAEDDIFVCINLTSRAIVGIACAGGASMRRPDSIPSPYTDEDGRYGKYMVPLKQYLVLRSPLPLEEVAARVGITADDKSKTNIHKGTPTEYSRPFFKGDEGSMKVRRYKNLIQELYEGHGHRFFGRA